MKPKNVLEFLGFRRRPRHYRYQVDRFELANDRTVYFAQWMSGYKSRRIIKNEHVESYREFISEGDFCIDIGAHIGDSTVPMAVAAGTEGCTLALEPNSYIYHVLEKNSRINRHVCRIESIMAAASDRDAFLNFNYSDRVLGNGGEHKGIPKWKHGHMYRQEVFAINLTRELQECYREWLPKLTFIKVDAEGADLHILRSLNDILCRYRPAIKCEVFKHTDRRQRRDLLEFLNGIGYRAWRIVGQPIARGPELTPDRMNDWTKFDLLAVADRHEPARAVPDAA